nr:hypothetical protein [uncultured Cohaesibacter sp.]
MTLVPSEMVSKANSFWVWIRATLGWTVSGFSIYWENYINPILIGAALIASLWATVLLIKQRRLDIKIKQKQLDDWNRR